MPTELRPPPKADGPAQQRYRRSVKLAIFLALVAAAFYATFVIMHVRT